MKTSFYRSRIKRIISKLNAESCPSALLLCSAPQVVRSRDTHHDYCQDKDFLYLTGCNDDGLAVLISNQLPKPLMIAPRPDKMKILWEGPRREVKAAIENLGAEIVYSDNIKAEIIKRLHGIKKLYHQNIEENLSSRIAKSIAKTPSHERGQLPTTLAHSDEILINMRLKKDPAEVALIQEAIEISYAAWRSSLPMVMAGTKESHIAATVDYGFRLADAESAFKTIIASGKNAAILHYQHEQDLLKKTDLLLFDFGASFQGYAADISRTVPVSGTFSTLQAELYDIVLEAQKAAIAKVKNDALIRDVHLAAARVITAGLVDLGVLRGKTSALLEKGAYRPYFPHGIGHSLGLDVHDIGNHRGNSKAQLSSGMVFTIEPGLYFSKRTGHIPACGIRIEDDVLVTKNACKILSRHIPKERKEIEQLMAF